MGDEVVHLRHRERRGHEVLVERRDPVGDDLVIGIGRVVEGDDDIRVEDDGQSSPNPSIMLVPVAAHAQAVGAAKDADVRLGPARLLHGAGQRAADELRLGQALVGRAAGESIVQIGVQVDARLLHPT